MEIRRKGLDELHEAMSTYIHVQTKKYPNSRGTKATPIDHLGTVMMSHGEEFGSDNPFGDCLIKLGIGHQKVASFQDEFVAKLSEGYMESLDRALASMKEYQSQRKKLESRRLAYDAALNKLQKAKKEKPQVEEELRAAKAKYDDTSEDVQNRMIAFRESEASHMRELTSFLEAAIGFHEQSRDALVSVKNTWVDEKYMQDQDMPKLNRAHSFTPRKDTADSTESEESKSHKTKRRSLFGLNRSPSSSSTLAPPKLRKAASASSMRQGSNGTPRKRVKVEFDFEAENENELTLVIGEIITVTGEIDENWWNGEIRRNGTVEAGIFPVNYTVLQEEDQVVDTPPPMPTRPKSRSIPPVQPQQQQTSALEPAAPVNDAVVKLCRVEFDYEAEAAKEISLHVGDIVRVTNDEDEGWWIGEVDSDQGVRRGWFPANYTVPYDEDADVEPEKPPPMPARPISGRSTASRPASDPYADHHDYEDEADNTPPPMPSRQSIPVAAPVPPLATPRRIAPMAKSAPSNQENITSQRLSSTGPPSIPPQARKTSVPTTSRPTSSISTNNFSTAGEVTTSPVTLNPPAIPSRATKPSPSRAASASSVPRLSTLEGTKTAMSTPGTGGGGGPSPRPGYVGKDYFGGAPPVQEAVVDTQTCSTCGCDEFSPNVFKKGSCNNCFHVH